MDFIEYYHHSELYQIKFTHDTGMDISQVIHFHRPLQL